ncbi:MAG: dihydroneopterin aldolase family protein [Halobacteriaceae archaeon]
MEVQAAHEACFEVGVKFGALYHQFAGTPVSPASAASLEAAIEAAIENQPHCVDVEATVLADALETTRGYAELTGRYLEATVTVEVEGVRAVAAMAMEDGYPLMRLTALERVD